MSLTVEEKRHVVQRISREVFGEGKLEVVDELIAPDFLDHDPLPGLPADREGLKTAVTLFRTAFPDFDVNLAHSLVDGDSVVDHITATGTQQGEFMGIPPTGKRIHTAVIVISRLDEQGRIKERWQRFGAMALLQQLGVIPGWEEPPPVPPAPVVEGGRETSVEENKAIMLRQLAIWNDGDFDVADEIFHPQAITPDAPQLPVGPEGCKEVARVFRTAFPDFHMTVEDVVAEGDLVVCRFQQTGTHQGDLFGIAPTGRNVDFGEIALCQIADGKIVADLVPDRHARADGPARRRRLTSPSSSGHDRSQRSLRVLRTRENEGVGWPSLKTSRSKTRRTSGTGSSPRTSRGDREQGDHRALRLRDEPDGPRLVRRLRRRGLRRGRADSRSGARPEGLKEAYKIFAGPFSDAVFVFADLFAEGDLVFGRGEISGTNDGEFFGIPPTDKKVSWTGTRLFRLKDNKVTHGWFNADIAGMLVQLGVAPAPPGPAAADPPPVMPTGAPGTREECKEIMRKLIDEVWAKGNLDLADELFHPEAICPSAPTLPVGPEGTKTIVQMVRDAFPDYWVRIDLIAAEADRVGARITQGGTHKGDFFGIPPTGKEVDGRRWRSCGSATARSSPPGSTATSRG